MNLKAPKFKANLLALRGALALVATLGLPATLRAQEPPPAADASSRASEYVIGSGDVLQVFVWKEADLTRDVTVRFDGKITVPLVGEVQAAGRTPGQLSTDLRAAFARFLSSPQVTAGVLQPNSSRFYVIGQVLKPGDFPLTGRITVLQGLALAGGFKEFAKSEGIVIIRHEAGAQNLLPVNYKRLEEGKDLSRNVVLRPGDTIIVP